MTNTVVALFPTQTAAEDAMNALLAWGYTSDQIGVALRGATRTASASANDPLLAHTGGSAGTSDPRVGAFTDELGYGGVVVTVQTDAAHANEVRAALAQFGATDEAQRPLVNLSPNDAAVREADAVDRPAIQRVAADLNHGASQTEVATASHGLVDPTTVAATEPSGVASFKPGEDE